MGIFGFFTLVKLALMSVAAPPVTRITPLNAEAFADAELFCTTAALLIGVEACVSAHYWVTERSLRNKHAINSLQNKIKLTGLH